MKCDTRYRGQTQQTYYVRMEIYTTFREFTLCNCNQSVRSSELSQLGNNVCLYQYLTNTDNRRFVLIQLELSLTIYNIFISILEFILNLPRTIWIPENSTGGTLIFQLEFGFSFIHQPELPINIFYRFTFNPPEAETLFTVNNVGTFGFRMCIYKK